MREIKFRVWDGIKMRDVIGNYALNGLIYGLKGHIFMQYTGLKDKNGKEIYEGDIIDKQYHNGEIYDGLGTVEMGEGSDSDGWAHGIWLGWMAGVSSLLDIHKECIMLGNIYENPELIKNHAIYSNTLG